VPAVIFDLGGVLISWDPVGAFRRVLPADQISPLMERIDFVGWNRRSDAGYPFVDAERELIERFPADEQAILGYRTHFSDTLTGMVPGTAAVLAELIKAGVRVAALTNWSAETFPYAERRFGILRRFEDILVSGAERIVKPDAAIFELALDRFGLPAEGTVFVDDSGPNVEAAAAVGLTARRFTDAETFRADLVELGLLQPRPPISEPIFHIADRRAWAELAAGGRYPWSSRGLGYEAQGFVHCSFAAQLPAVLDAHYADVAWSELVVLELDPTGLPVVVEDLGAGPFPHLYAELETAMVRHAAPGPDRLDD
jgi:2-haloacid dehalogenase